MRLSFKNKIICGTAALILCAAAYQILQIRKSARTTLADSRARLLEQTSVPFEKISLTPRSSRFIRILQNTNETRDLIRFQNSYFAATGGGLVQLSEDGKPLKHFTVSDGLPESDLTALAVWNNKLYIGSRSKNLITFNGEKFENYVWTDRRAQAVTAFSEADGKLLIGTFGGGLLEFDGVNFSEIKAEKTRIASVNCLLKDGAKLFVGTFDNGLWIYESDVWTHFTTAEGLPSNRVVGIVSNGENLYVATDFGLSIFQNKTFHALAVLPSLSSLVRHENKLFLTKDNGEIFTFETNLKEFAGGKNSVNLQKARLISADEKLWFLSNQGIAEIKNAKIKIFSQTKNESLTDNFVSALAFDKNENLWVGTFRNGIDIFSAGGKKIKHLESETLREINFLQAGGAGVSAATASGLQTFNTDFSIENLTKKDGLPSASITHFSNDFIATAKGLAFRENGKIRVLSTVQNLPNNSVYTTAQIGGKLYAGTLGGLAEIENGRVARTYRDSNSNLKTNWVTALIYADERLFIGTYGGGIFELMPSGEIHSFEGETGKFVVNPNAMFSDGNRLYAGTLAGVKVLDLRTQSWQSVKHILPAETVLSITGDNENIYFGTTNGIAEVKKDYFTKGESE
jgi:ligand-binding sensor domain-containing protein